MIKKILIFLKYIWYFLLTLPRDLRAIRTLNKIVKKSKKCDQENYSVQDVFSQWVKKQPNKPCIIFNEQTWTFKDVNTI